MKIRPLYDRIVVKRIEEKEQMQGGLYIPDSAKEKAAGRRSRGRGQGQAPGRRQGGSALDVQVGDRILFGKYSGSDIKLDGEEYLIMREDEVLGILERRKAGSGQERSRKLWRNKLYIPRIPVRRFCAASTSWPTR
jgi:chaperonin GroES